MDIFLFDIDGVLLYPGGYRAALASTVNQFSQAMGWGNCAPEEHVTSVFEAYGITSEWDITAICLSGLFNAAWQQSHTVHWPTSVPQALDAVRVQGIPAQSVDYAQIARNIAAEMHPGEYPSLAAPRVFARELDSYADKVCTQSITELLDEILLTTRDIHRSHTLSVFQTYLLGSELYRQTYGLEPIFVSPSMIMKYDELLLSLKNRERILTAVRAGVIKAVLYTARPSLPPNVEDPNHYYSSEAEMAASLAGLVDLPLVGLGSMQWLARDSDLEPDSYVKPSPVHAIAAIGTAASDVDPALMRAAHSLGQDGKFMHPILGLKGENIHVRVFEDSAHSIQAVQHAVDILINVGIPAKFTAYGIARHSEKRSTLVASGARVFDDVNAALVNLLP